MPSILQPRESRESKDGGLVLACTIFGWVLNGALGGKEPKDPTVNFVDANATLSKQFEDYCNLEFNDSSYEAKISMSQNNSAHLK